jgi:hypothetical protein
MRNCLILGSPRGGTSLLAGTLFRAGYFMGNYIWPADEYNPKGQFEDVQVNGINEELLESVVPKVPKRPIRWFHRRHDFRYGQRWLAVVPPGVEIKPQPGLEPDIRALVARQPYCFKDPRFSYTLPAWRPFIGDAVLLCIFREPARTANSIVNCLERNPALSNLTMNFDAALDVWTTMYERIVTQHKHQGDWLFIHYEQIMNGSAAARIRSALGVEPDLNFPDDELRRSRPDGALPSRTHAVYDELCDLAGFAQRIPA